MFNILEKNAGNRRNVIFLKIDIKPQLSSKRALSDKKFLNNL